jgi:hypothetical protein
MPELQAVPIERAREVAETYGATMIVVIVRDHAARTGTTSWGKHALDKAAAEAIADKIMWAVSSTERDLKSRADFHDTFDAARLREAEELLQLVAANGRAIDVIRRIDEFLCAGKKITKGRKSENTK